MPTLSIYLVCARFRTILLAPLCNVSCKVLRRDSIPSSSVIFPLQSKIRTSPIVRVVIFMANPLDSVIRLIGCTDEVAYVPANSFVPPYGGELKIHDVPASDDHGEHPSGDL